MDIPQNILFDLSEVVDVRKVQFAQLKGLTL